MENQLPCNVFFVFALTFLVLFLDSVDLTLKKKETATRILICHFLFSLDQQNEFKNQFLHAFCFFFSLLLKKELCKDFNAPLLSLSLEHQNMLKF